MGILLHTKTYIEDFNNWKSKVDSFTDKNNHTCEFIKTGDNLEIIVKRENMEINRMIFEPLTEVDNDHICYEYKHKDLFISDLENEILSYLGI